MEYRAAVMVASCPNIRNTTLQPRTFRFFSYEYVKHHAATGIHTRNMHITVELPQVAAVAHLLHGYGINIVETDQFTDPFSAVYFQRLKVD